MSLASPPTKNAVTGSNESSSAVREARKALRPVGSIQQPTFGTEPTEAQKMRQQITGKARRRRTRRTRRRVRGGEYTPELERTLRDIGVNERTGAQDSASQFQTGLLGLKKTVRRGAKRRSLSTRGASRGTRCY